MLSSLTNLTVIPKVRNIHWRQKHKPIAILVSVFATLFSSQAHAAKDCDAQIDRIYTRASVSVGATDAAVILARMVGGGDVYLREDLTTEASFQSLYTLLLTANASNASITVRYSDNATNCNALPTGGNYVGDGQAIQGIWLN